MNANRRHYVMGLIFGASSFFIWGLLPLYWKLVQALDPYQVFAHRVVWSFGFMLLVLGYRKDLLSFFSLVKQPKLWLVMFGPALFISINWLTYIWSVTQGYVIEASLGYYMNPLVLTLFGILFYKERLSLAQTVGIGLAAIGVIIKTLAYGQVPYIAFVLAISFALYGLLKKMSQMDTIKGLSFETLIVGAPALFYILFHENAGLGISGNLPGSFWLLIGLSGIATATPLLLYAESTKRLPLNIVGVLQYISPTISLLLGIFVFGEHFTLSSLIAFGFIWAGLFCFLPFKWFKPAPQKA